MDRKVILPSSSSEINKALGKSIEVHWFDSGHFGAGIEQDIQNLEIMLGFAHRVLG